ncbi:MAG: hypothetical protein ACK56Q_10520, partial [Pirellulaceae bacterium]
CIPRGHFRTGETPYKSRVFGRTRRILARTDENTPFSGRNFYYHQTVDTHYRKGTEGDQPP